MNALRRAALAMTAALSIATLGACNSQAINDILGGVLGGPQNQVAGTIRGVDTRNAQITLQASNGQNVALSYDNNTKVIYQNQSYAVTALENGDQVTARVSQLQGGGYYTDSIHVTQSVSGTTSGGTTSGSGTVQALQGTVRQIDRTNGWFTIDAGTNVTLTVTMPYNPSSTDASRFQALRVGDFVRFEGVFVNQSRVELRRFN